MNLNNLNHESKNFVLPNKFNGYDVSYLAVKYLIDTHNENDFNKLIRNNAKVKKIGENVWKKVIQYTKGDSLL